MAVECEKSVQALVTHLRCGVSSTQSTVTAVTQEVSKGALGGPMISISDDDSGCGGSSGGSNLDHMIYEWTPENLTSQQVSAFFSGWPEEKIPYVRSIGAEWRRSQLMTQLPLHDQDIKKCKSLTTADEKREMRMFIAERKRDALGQGSARQIPLTHYAMQCTKCGGDMLGGEVAVYAVRAGHAKVWHPGCFQCDTCNELLIDLIYFWKDPHIYCGRHHAHTLKPRCSACDEIIFSDECTEAESNWWHLNHFCCVECDTQLGGNRYIMHQQQPYCIHCYESIFAQHCSTCKNVIGVDEGQMSYENQHWHATDSCFCCANCSKPLLGLPFLPKRKTLFCSLACNNQFNPSSTLQPQHTRSSSSQQPLPVGESPQPLEAGTPSFEFQHQQTTSAQFLPASSSAAAKSTPASAAAQLSNFKNRSLTDSDDSTSTTQTEPGSQLEKLAENLTLCSSNTLPKQLTSHPMVRNSCSGPGLTSPEGLNNCNPNLTMTATTSWTHKTPSSTRPPLCQTSKTTTSPKNFVKPFNYIPPKVVSPKHQSNKTNNNNSNNTNSNSVAASSLTSSLTQVGTVPGVTSKDEDNDSAVSSMTSSNVETPPVSVDIYSPPSLGEEPPPLPPKPAFMKGHSSPEKTANPSNASTNETQDNQTLLRVEDHVYTEAGKAAKFQRSLPDLNKKKSNLKNKTLEEELCCVNSAGNAKIVSFNPNVRERTRSSSLPRCNSQDEFNEGSVVEPEYQFRKSHYKSRSKCSRRSSRHRRHGSQLQHYHQYYYHYKQHHYNHEYCSDPEDCTGSERFSALPWEYYSDSSSSTSSSSDDDVSTPGFINPPQPSGSGFGTGSVISGGGSAGATSSIQRQRRRHRRSKKNKCKIS